MTVVSVHEAKTHLSRLIERVLAGEEIVVARNKEPVIKLVPAAPLKKKPLLGAMKGMLDDIGEEAFRPLTDEELADWQDGKI
jgi:prevent-host-death family protein